MRSHRSRTQRSFALVACAAACAALAACSSGASSAASAALGMAVEDTADDYGITLAVQQVVDVADAVDADTSGAWTVATGVDPTDGYTVLGAGAGSLVAVEAAAGATLTAAGTPSRSTVGLLADGGFTAVGTSGAETSGPLQGADRYVEAAAVGDDTLVWTEVAPNGGAYGALVVRAAGLDGGTVVDLAHNTQAVEAAVARTFGGSSPVVGDGWAYWSTLVPAVDSPDPAVADDWSSVVQRAPLDGSAEAEVVATDAGYPALSDGTLYYVSYQGTEAASYDVHAQSVLDPADDQVVATGSRTDEAWVTGLTAGAGHVAWRVSSPDGAENWQAGSSASGALFVLATGGTEVVQVLTDSPQTGGGAMAFSADALVWGDGPEDGTHTEYRLDLTDLTVTRLGQEEDFSDVAADPAGTLVAWTTDDGDAGSVWNVVDGTAG